MCKYKEVRKDYGTIYYEQSQVEVPELKINYNELFEIKKLSGADLPIFEQEEGVKRVEVTHKSKEEKIREIAEGTKQKTEKETNQELEEQKEQEEKEELRESEQESKEQLEPETEPEPAESSGQKGGGLLRKKIYVTNLSVEKDKEMFQM